MARQHLPRSRAWVYVLAIAVAVVGGIVSPIPVRSQVPRLEATPAPTPVPSGDPWDSVWDEAPTLQVVLSAQQIAPPFGGGGVASLTVRALHDDDRIFILLEWYDDDVDDAVDGSTVFADAAAVQFPAVTGDEPVYTMGSADHPVTIWQWKAVWQADIDRGFATGLSRYHDTAVDMYPNGDDPRYNPARYVGNQLADPAHLSPIETLIAEGFGTLTFAEVQDVFGAGSWRSGTWRALFTRDFNSTTGNASFAVGEDSLIAFAVWDGGAGDRNGQKSIAPFIVLGISDEVASATPQPGPAGSDDLPVLLVITAVMVLMLTASVGGMVRAWARADFGAKK